MEDADLSNVLRTYVRLSDLCNTVDVALVAYRRSTEFELLSARVTAGARSTRREPLLIEGSNWFALRIQRPLRDFTTLVDWTKKGRYWEKLHPKQPHHVVLSSAPAGWFSNGIGRSRVAVFGAGENPITANGGATWGPLFATPHTFREWANEIEARDEFHDLPAFVDAFALRQPFYSHSDVCQMHAEVEFPLYEQATEWTSRSTTVRFTSPVTDWDGLKAKWKRGSQTGQAAIKPANGRIELIVDGTPAALELSLVYREQPIAKIGVPMPPDGVPPPSRSDRSLELVSGEFVLRGDGLVTVRNGLLNEMNALDALREEAATLLGRELQPLSQLANSVRQLYELFDRAQAEGAARVLLTDEGRGALRAALHRIQEDVATSAATNNIRQRLGASPDEMLPRTRRVEGVAAALHGLIGEASEPRTLRQWLEAESSPRLELLRKACKTFLDTGEWLKLGGEVKAWKKRDPDADVDREAKSLWRYARIDGDKLVPRVEAFALFPEADEYFDRVLSLLRLGIDRFLKGAHLEQSQRLKVNEPELAAIAASMPVERLMRFVNHLSCLGGHNPSPFEWTPDRDVLAYFPAETVGDLISADDLFARQRGSAEECLWLLRVIADRWIESHEWPTLDAVIADRQVGPKFAPALKSLNHLWIKSPDHRRATLDLDGLVLGASNANAIVQSVAIIVGTLADELEAEQHVSVVEVARLTGMETEFVGRLLPLLDRSDLGLSIFGLSSNQPEAVALPYLAEYLNVRTGDELAARWIRNRERHPDAGRATDGARLNVFGARTLRDRLLALGARGRDLHRIVESSVHAVSSGEPAPSSSTGEAIKGGPRPPRVSAFAAQAQRKVEREAAESNEAAQRCASVERIVPSLLQIVADTCRDLDEVVLHASQCGLRIQSSRLGGPNHSLEQALKGLATDASTTVWTCEAFTDIEGVLDIRLSAQYRKHDNRWPVFLKLWVASHPVRAHGHEIEFAITGAPVVPDHSVTDPEAALPRALEFVLLVASMSLAKSELGHAALQWFGSKEAKDRDGARHAAGDEKAAVVSASDLTVVRTQAPATAIVAQQVAPESQQVASLRSRLTGGEHPQLDVRDAPWNGELPDVEPGVPDALYEAAAAGVDVLLMTAVPVEREAVLRLMKPLPGRARIAEAPVGHLTYYVGAIGDARVVLTMSRPGAIGRDASILTSHEAVQTCAPRSVIAVGIAFGGYTQKLKIGDVLFSNRVVSYEPARKQAAGDRPRGAHYEPGPILLNRFRNVLGWRFARPDGKRCSSIEGQLLSGEKLVDDLDFKEEQFTHFPESAGGEMEGAGVAAAAERSKVEWIIVKAVCDWGDGTKGDDYQLLAAASAASLVAHVISPKAALADLPRAAHPPATRRS